MRENTDIFAALEGTGLLTGVVVLAATWATVRVVTGTFRRLGDRFSDRRLVLNQLATLARFTLYLGGIALAVALSVHLSKEVVVGLLGTLAVAIGFALKDLTASVLAGIIIIFDRPFQVGDRVTFAGTYGEVQSIGLRSVRLVTLDDNVVTIPNHRFLTDVVASGNWGALDMQVELDFFVGVDQDVALAKQLVAECVRASRYVYLGKPWIVVASQRIHESYFAVRLRARAHVLDVKYEQDYATDVTERALAAFRQHGVHPPALLHRSVDGAPIGERVLSA